MKKKEKKKMGITAYGLNIKRSCEYKEGKKKCVAKYCAMVGCIAGGGEERVR